MQRMKRWMGLLCAMAVLMGAIPGTAALAEEKAGRSVKQQAAEVNLNEQIELKVGSDIFTPGNLGSSEFGNVKEMFKGKEIAYTGLQLMELHLTIPVQAGLEVTNVVPGTPSLYPEYSKLEKGADAYTYSHYVKENGTYDFRIEYTINGVAASKTVQYTMSDMVEIPDITMRAYLLEAIDSNKYHGYITKTDISEGHYYSTNAELQTGHQIDPGYYGGPDYYFAYVKDLTGIEYMTTMKQISFYSNSFYKSKLDLTSLEPMTRGYYPNMDRFQFTGPYDTETKVSPDAYDSEMLGRILEKMPNLTEFSANRTGFKNFEAFGKMNGKMQVIGCKQNQITSLAGLEKHTGLTHLSLNVNKITDLTPLANVKDAYSWNFIQNEISDLRPIHNINVTRQIHFGFQSVYPEPVAASLKGDTYELELPMPIDIDGTLTQVGFASFLESALGSQVPAVQRDKLLVKYGDGQMKLYPITERDGKSYAEIPAADVPDAKTDRAFENSIMRFWFQNDQGSDSRTRGVFNGKVDFTATAAPASEGYKVLYSFVSAEKGKSLPKAVNDQLPMDEMAYAMGDTVTAIQPQQTTIQAADGSWTFMGYYPAEQAGQTITEKRVSASTLEQGESAADDQKYVRFYGKWTFTQNL